MSAVDIMPQAPQPEPGGTQGYRQRHGRSAREQPAFEAAEAVPSRKQAIEEQIAQEHGAAVMATAFMNSSQLAPMSTGTTKVAVNIQI